MLCSLLSIAVARPTQGRSVSAFQQAGGPGRDLLALHEMGCEATGVDGCEEFVMVARQRCPQATARRRLSRPPPHTHSSAPFSRLAGRRGAALLTSLQVQVPSAWPS